MQGFIIREKCMPPLGSSQGMPSRDIFPWPGTRLLGISAECRPVWRTTGRSERFRRGILRPARAAPSWADVPVHITGMVYHWDDFAV